MSHTTNDIDALLDYLGLIAIPEAPRYHRALAALVAERDSLRAEIAAAYRDRASARSVIDLVKAERDALNRRVAELEAHPHADRDCDLRQRLVCAALNGILSEQRGLLNHEYALRAIGLADATLAAMRKGDA